MDDDDEIENEEQFWEELDDIVSTPCRTHERIDDTLRTYLGFSSTHKGQYTQWECPSAKLTFEESYLSTEQSVLRCSYALLCSPLYAKSKEYVRRQLVYCLLQEDDQLALHLAVSFLLADGQRNDDTFILMNNEGAFTRLIQLLREGVDDDRALHRVLLELLYEMSRVQQVTLEHLTSVDDAFVVQLFQMVESLSNDVKDPYHGPVIRLLLVLNEQYMISAHEPLQGNGASTSVTNRVLKAISTHGKLYKTFGESLILLLNRESETSLQFLILKLLYLTFTTSSTREYFYTNDLYVLVDILIRNLLDLPDSSVPTATSLRHTYLRVLHPLLENTQLRLPPHYKRQELRRMLYLIADAGAGNRHFEQPDATTVRLVKRCLAVEWLKEDSDEQMTATKKAEAMENSAEASGQTTVAKRAVGLGLELPEAQESSLSVVEMATKKEKPGVLMPSRGRGASDPEKSPFEDA